MKEVALAAFEQAKKSGESGWHTVSSIIVPYMAASGKYTVHTAFVKAECLALAARRLLKVRFGNCGRLEFKLAY
jgi:hypothetical protein